jgi:hypothetical protein
MNQPCDETFVYAFAEGCDELHAGLVNTMLRDRATGSAGPVPEGV